MAFVFTVSFAQLQNNGTIYVKHNSKLFLKSGNYGFGTSSISKTTRTATYGKIIFGASATTSGSSNSLFLDGYGSTLSNSAFIVPVGESSVLAPVRIVASTTGGVDVAFYKSQQSQGVALGSGVAQISTTQHWNISGVSSKISLSYNASTVSGFTTSLYTIVGYNTSTNKWDEIPSSIDVYSVFTGSLSNATAGSITSTGNVDITTTYKYFTIGRKEPCAPLVDSSGNIKTWNGNWLPNEPALDGTDPVVISSAYSGNSFACNSLLLNADVTLGDGKYIDCVNGVTGSGKIIMASSASFVQRNSDANIGKPSIELTKSTATLRRYEFVYWGSPVSENIFSQLAGAKASTLATEDPANAFDYYITWTPNMFPASGWGSLGGTAAGSGFATRVRNQAPFNNATNTDFVNLKITGTANNGDVTVNNVINNPTYPNGNSSHNLLANPYPSAIDADVFLDNNAAIDGVVYVWTNATAPPTVGTYNQADYLAYTRLGATRTGLEGGIFDGKIASGQGFMVKALLPSASSPSVTFTNCMRLTGNNGTFYKAATVVDRYKVNMTGDNGVFSQIIVGYIPEGTLGYDRMYDAGRNSASTAQLSTFLDNTTQRLAINARPIFSDADVVSVGITKNNANAETFVISLDEPEGIFNSGNVTVYLHDKVQNVYHNLNNGSYTFTTTETNISNRFKLLYQPDSTLGNTDFNVVKTLISLNDNVFKVTSTQQMSSISIYDVAGRLMANYDNVNSTIFSSEFNKAQGVYIAKIKLTDGRIVSEKVLNQ